MSTSEATRLRYSRTSDPVQSDGRDVDTTIGALVGEGAHQEVKRVDSHMEELSPTPWDRVPSVSGGDATYYDRPMLKKSVWSIDIPLYYFLGGTAGASLTLGAALQLACPRCEHPLRRLSAICHWTGVVGSTAGAAFLIHDLGRPARFLYMMRVFRPTSPMNIGTWILGGAAPTAVFTALFVNREDFLGRIAEVTGYLSGIFGVGLAGYTGVLVCNSALPIWQESRRWMPAMFIASSAASAASVLDILADEQQPRIFTRIFGTAGRVAEIIAAHQVEQAASAIPKVGEPLHEGFTGVLWNLSTGLTIASLGVSLLSGRNRRRSALAGALGMAGSLCLRFAVHYASNASAQDPRASFHQQRAGRNTSR